MLSEQILSCREPSINLSMPPHDDDDAVVDWNVLSHFYYLKHTLAADRLTGSDASSVTRFNDDLIFSRFGSLSLPLTRNIPASRHSWAMFHHLFHSLKFKIQNMLSLSSKSVKKDYRLQTWKATKNSINFIKWLWKKLLSKSSRAENSVPYS